jgi:hypothetical protein
MTAIYFKVLKGQRKTIKHLSRNRWSPGKYVNQGLPEHEARVFTIWPQCSVRGLVSVNRPQTINMVRQEFNGVKSEEGDGMTLVKYPSL